MKEIDIQFQKKNLFRGAVVISILSGIFILLVTRSVYFKRHEIEHIENNRKTSTYIAMTLEEELARHVLNEEDYSLHDLDIFDEKAIAEVMTIAQDAPLSFGRWSDCHNGNCFGDRTVKSPLN